MSQRFYKGRTALNVLAKDIANAKEIYEAAEGYVLVGVLSKDYKTVEEAVTAMKQYGQEIEDAVSIGLGAGDNRQAAIVA
ncbi:MAG TPA: 2-dehydro-3-deoxyphosphooctonate aldolase, partial [Paenibacillus sp.]|nr:2-dehydro-3-deoxyphosphooctonate aldolase [Paenibacillus sp.]